MVTNYLSSFIKEKSEEEKLQDKKAQEEIDTLAPELQAIAEKYKHLDAHRALAEAKAQEEIDALAPELKAVADESLSHWNCPSNALAQAEAREVIGRLSPERREVADFYLWNGNQYTAALANALQENALSQYKTMSDLLNTIRKTKSVEPQVRKNPKEQAKAQEEIDMLPPELKAVADKYLAREWSPTSALAEARAQGEITELPPEKKKIADFYLEHGNPPTVALSYAMGNWRGDE